MKKAYSYQRFSSMKQKEGDSLQRQQREAQGFCKDFGLQLASTFKDEGVSGFKGKNFSNESALGRFLKLVEDGTIEKGSVLIVENMDRLSRQAILPCLSKFIDIINQGVSIGVISQRKILDEESITKNPMDLMLVLVEFARANNESETKRNRARSVIQGKIERVKNGKKIWFAVQKPSWITGLKNGKFTLDNKKVQLVHGIFSKYLSGDSCNKIADSLNKAKVQTLRNIENGIWTNVTVAELLRNKNVIGWFGINGNEFNDYYPPIVSDKDFQLVQQRLAFNVNNRGGSKYGIIRNLFKGLLFCADCGQAIETKINTYRNAQGSLNHYADYVCRGVKQKTGCTNIGRISVCLVELAVFENVLFKNPRACFQNWFHYLLSQSKTTARWTKARKYKSFFS
jgi:DNA invertase Pin-like site-specific DNA recombinase